MRQKSLISTAAVTMLLLGNAVMGGQAFAEGHGGHGHGGQGSSASAGAQAGGHGHGQQNGPTNASGQAQGAGHAGKGHGHGDQGQKNSVRHHKGSPNSLHLQGVVAKVYGAVDKLDAYTSLTLAQAGTGAASGKHEGHHERKEQAHKQANDLRSAEHFLAAAVRQLSVTERVYQSEAGDANVTTATYGDTSVTTSTYGNGSGVVNTLQAVATALSTDESAIQGLATGQGDVSSIVADLNAQIATLQGLQAPVTDAKKDNTDQD